MRAKDIVQTKLMTLSSWTAEWSGSVITGRTGQFSLLTHHSSYLLNKFQSAFQFAYRNRQTEKQINRHWHTNTCI